MDLMGTNHPYGKICTPYLIRNKMRLQNTDKKKSYTYMILLMSLWIMIACGSSSDDEETTASPAAKTNNPTIGPTVENFKNQPPSFPLIDLVKQENET